MLYLPRWQYWLAIFVCVLSPIILLTNFSATRDYTPFTNKINLGLDLQGGAHLVYKADMQSYFNNKLGILKNDIRKTLRPSSISLGLLVDDEDKKLIGYRNLRIIKNSVLLNIVNDKQIDLAIKRLKKLIAPVEGKFVDDYKIIQEDNMIVLQMSNAYMSYLTDNVISQTIEVMRRRIDAFGTREPNIIRQGEDAIILQVPGESNIERLKSEVGKTAQMTFHMVVDNEQYFDKNQTIRLPMQERPNEILTLEKDPLISGDNLVNSQSSRDENGQPAVSFTFDSLGSEVFSRVTSENIGRLFAIVLDGTIISSPRIQSAILGGRGIITGNFSPEEAGNLSLLLRSGALPVELKVIEERTVGPELGAESVKAGTKSLIYGFIFVSIFMIFYYGLAGIFSAVSLVVNTVMVFSVLSIMSATLTLPGMAGIVLGIGVAVDANVLINERIREEIRYGRSVIKAVSIGYDKAWATILDSHITGILSAIVMFSLGSGPIRGFAVTLGVGILLSLFTAVWISKLLFAYYITKKKPEKLKFGLSGA